MENNLNKLLAVHLFADLIIVDIVTIVYFLLANDLARGVFIVFFVTVLVSIVITILRITDKESKL